MSSNIQIQRICQHCGKGFTAKTNEIQAGSNSEAVKINRILITF
jgi:hypothetical protein